MTLLHFLILAHWEFELDTPGVHVLCQYGALSTVVTRLNKERTQACVLCVYAVCMFVYAFACLPVLM